MTRVFCVFTHIRVKYDLKIHPFTFLHPFTEERTSPLAEAQEEIVRLVVLTHPQGANWERGLWHNGCTSSLAHSLAYTHTHTHMHIHTYIYALLPPRGGSCMDQFLLYEGSCLSVIGPEGHQMGVKQRS